MTPDIMTFLYACIIDRRHFTNLQCFIWHCTVQLLVLTAYLDVPFTYLCQCVYKPKARDSCTGQTCSWQLWVIFSVLWSEKAKYINFALWIPQIVFKSYLNFWFNNLLAWPGGIIPRVLCLLKGQSLSVYDFLIQAYRFYLHGPMSSNSLSSLKISGTSRWQLLTSY